MMMMIYESRPDPGLGKRVYADTQCLVAAVCCRHSHGRIDQHRAGVLSLDGSTAFRPHAPYHTGLWASEHSRDSPFSLLPLLGPPATPTRCLSPYLVPPGNPSWSQVFKPRNRPPGWIVFGDARQQSLAATSWEMGVLGRHFPGSQVVTKRSRELAECDPGVLVLH